MCSNPPADHGISSRAGPGQCTRALFLLLLDLGHNLERTEQTKKRLYICIYFFFKDYLEDRRK